MSASIAIIAGRAIGPVIASSEALSFWGGIDPATGCVIDAFHPLFGQCLTGAILMLPTSRGSCTGSGVLLDLILSGRTPAALIFSEAEDVLTLGALVASEMFSQSLPILRLSAADFRALATRTEASIETDHISAQDLHIDLTAIKSEALDLSKQDQDRLAGGSGQAAAQAMRILCAMAVQQGATQFIDVSRAHIDGCIYASPANLTFADRMVALGAKVVVPTTMNAISVDQANWRLQGVAEQFGAPAERLATAYVAMGCRPTFTCAPYLLEGEPKLGESIGWSESNAVIYANSVLGARTAKHPDFLDLCIALTGRAPLSGVYVAENRRPDIVIDVEMPVHAQDAVWPLIGYLAGKASPGRIPLLRGLSSARPGPDQLKALCAAFGTTSAAPMLHIEGVTPECDLLPRPNAQCLKITNADLRETWTLLNAGSAEIDLVAIGSPHASLEECRVLAMELGLNKVLIPTIVTAGRNTIDMAKSTGTLQKLKDAGVQVIPDLCWCSISEPVFPVATTVVMTDSGKYAHYGPGLSGRKVRFGDLSDCIAAALTGLAPPRLPAWLT